MYVNVKRVVFSCNYQVTCAGLVALQHYGSRVNTMQGKQSWPTPIWATIAKVEMSHAVVVATVLHPG